MFFRKSKEKELKMIWQVEKNNRKSYLIGTAHFFPYSFRSSFKRYFMEVDRVMFEGPLDKENMNKVVAAGCEKDSCSHVFDEIDQETINDITERLFPGCRPRNPYFCFNFQTCKTENPLYEMVKGMKPWMAFFTIWSKFLERKGWRNSVDLEAYHIAKELGKRVIFLETIEEQIEVLENLSQQRIKEYLENVHLWDDYSKEYLKDYLRGNFKKLKTITRGFPSRQFSVIDKRDGILYARMASYFEKGNSVACVGAPHIWGIREILQTNGYETRSAVLS
jgi:uncharacterized protein YbaP (TraB family)